MRQLPLVPHLAYPGPLAHSPWLVRLLMRLPCPRPGATPPPSVTFSWLHCNSSFLGHPRGIAALRMLLVPTTLTLPPGQCRGPPLMGPKMFLSTVVRLWCLRRPPSTPSGVNRTHSFAFGYPFPSGPIAAFSSHHHFGLALCILYFSPTPCYLILSPSCPMRPSSPGYISPLRFLKAQSSLHNISSSAYPRCTHPRLSLAT